MNEDFIPPRGNVVATAAHCKPRYQYKKAIYKYAC
jgi:hypothetical protein